jgi:hypothetical protein
LATGTGASNPIKYFTPLPVHAIYGMKYSINLMRLCFLKHTQNFFMATASKYFRLEKPDFGQYRTGRHFPPCRVRMHNFHYICPFIN